MLGPEQVNMALRPTPIFLEGLVAIRISEQMGKNLGLKSHQIVHGVIENRGDLLKLILNNRQIEWGGAKRFKVGDRVNFCVQSALYGYSLRPISLEMPERAATSSAISQRLLSLFYRPDQPSVLAQLFKPASMRLMVAQSDAENNNQLFGQLRQSISTVSPELIRNALLNSGLFGEHRLAKQMPQKADIKQWLRAVLRTAVITSQGRLATDIERAIEQIESHQLDSLQAQINREVSYSFTLPFVDANPVEIQFGRQAYDSEQEQADWIINLHTDSQLLGELWLKTTVKIDAGMDMTLWAERAQVARIAKKTRYDLEDELRGFGLELNKLTVLNASRPSVDRGLASPGHVVDLST